MSVIDPGRVVQKAHRGRRIAFYAFQGRVLLDGSDMPRPPSLITESQTLQVAHTASLRARL